MYDYECSFCNEILGSNYNNFFNIYIENDFKKCGLNNRIVGETKNYLLMPMVGPLVPGYLLLLPKEHYSSFANMDEEQIEEAICIKNIVKKLFYKYYGKSVVFEHGALNKLKKGACCSDHAHLHIVATPVDVMDCFSDYGFDVREIDSLKEVRCQVSRNMPYLFYEDFEGKSILMDAPIVETQFIRKLLATKMGEKDRSLWNKNIHVDWMIDIIKKLKNEIGIKLKEQIY